MRLGPRPALALLLALAAGPAQAAPRPVDLAARAVARADASLDGVLGELDGGPLTQALTLAVIQGRRLRLLLDPRQRPTRLAGLELQALSPTVEVRWSRWAGHPLRWLLVDSTLALAWQPDATRTATDAGMDRAGFERRWSQASTKLPEGLRLDDQLKALPDPSDQRPHYIRRRQGAGPGDDHANPARPQPQGP